MQPRAYDPEPRYPAQAGSVAGLTPGATPLAPLVRRPFRTRPTCNTTPCGGHRGQRALGMNRHAPNTALGYELIAPVSGVLAGMGAENEVGMPFSVVVALYARDMLGAAVHAIFDTSSPVGFDYLNTVGGDSLLVHCDPQSEYVATFRADGHQLLSTRDAPLPEDTADGFHGLTVVEGGSGLVRGGGREHALSYAETMVLPAAVGGYALSRVGSGRACLVKALVP